VLNFLRIWIRNILGFSGRETNGFLILLPVILLIVLSEPMYRIYIGKRVKNYSVDQKRLDSIIGLWQTEPVSKVAELKVKKTERFRFNPNLVTVEDLVILGFPEKLAKRVASYRQKGGKFTKPSDLKRIYGMDSILFNSLEHYIVIPIVKGEQSAKQPDKPAIQSQKVRLNPFDINEADTAALKSVYGIGTKLAERISKFRLGLGGFVSMNQLSEIYGLDSIVVDRLKKRAFIKENFEPKKLNLNTSTESEMSSHPYISKSTAKAIMAWRFQHGPFRDINELKNLTVLKPEDIVKIIPYLKVEE
jgi:competence protein ComEA